jgi:hypothetical protein
VLRLDTWIMTHEPIPSLHSLVSASMQLYKLQLGRKDLCERLWLR